MCFVSSHFVYEGGLRVVGSFVNQAILFSNFRPCFTQVLPNFWQSFGLLLAKFWTTFVQFLVYVREKEFYRNVFFFVSFRIWRGLKGAWVFCEPSHTFGQLLIMFCLTFFPTFGQRLDNFCLTFGIHLRIGIL